MTWPLGLRTHACLSSELETYQPFPPFIWYLLFAKASWKFGSHNWDQDGWHECVQSQSILAHTWGSFGMWTWWWNCRHQCGYESCRWLLTTYEAQQYAYWLYQALITRQAWEKRPANQAVWSCGRSNNNKFTAQSARVLTLYYIETTTCMRKGLHSIAQAKYSMLWLYGDPVYQWKAELLYFYSHHQGQYWFPTPLRSTAPVD